jgi:hypothetical protein
MTKRPRPLDPDVIENVAGRLFPEVKNWLEERGEVFIDELEQDLFGELVNLLHHDQDWDGYVLARELEERSWTPDAELVEILHQSHVFAYHSLREEVARWVAENALVLTHIVGDHVVFKLYPNEPPMEGHIMATHPEVLEYSVQLLGRDVTLLIPGESVYGGSRE